MEAVVRLYDHATMQRGRALVGSEDYRFWDEIATALLAAMVP